MAAPVSKMITCNRLRDGEVLYWKNGIWVTDLQQGEVFADEASAEAALALVQKDIAESTEPPNADNYYYQNKWVLNTLGHNLPRGRRRATLGETAPASVFTGKHPCERNCWRPCSPWRRSLASPQEGTSPPHHRRSCPLLCRRARRRPHPHRSARNRPRAPHPSPIASRGPTPVSRAPWRSGPAALPAVSG